MSSPSLSLSDKLAADISHRSEFFSSSQEDVLKGTFSIGSSSVHASHLGRAQRIGRIHHRPASMMEEVESFRVQVRNATSRGAILQVRGAHEAHSNLLNHLDLKRYDPDAGATISRSASSWALRSAVYNVLGTEGVSIGDNGNDCVLRTAGLGLRPTFETGTYDRLTSGRRITNVKMRSAWAKSDRWPDPVPDASPDQAIDVFHTNSLLEIGVPTVNDDRIVRFAPVFCMHDNVLYGFIPPRARGSTYVVAASGSGKSYFLERRDGHYDGDLVMQWHRRSSWIDSDQSDRDQRFHNMLRLAGAMSLVPGRYYQSSDFGGHLVPDAVVDIPEMSYIHRLETRDPATGQKTITDLARLLSDRDELRSRYPAKVYSSFVAVPTDLHTDQHYDYSLVEVPVDVRITARSRVFPSVQEAAWWFMAHQTDDHSFAELHTGSEFDRDNEASDGLTLSESVTAARLTDIMNAGFLRGPYLRYRDSFYGVRGTNNHASSAPDVMAPGRTELIEGNIIALGEYPETFHDYDERVAISGRRLSLFLQLRHNFCNDDTMQHIFDVVRGGFNLSSDDVSSFQETWDSLKVIWDRRLHYEATVVRDLMPFRKTLFGAFSWSNITNVDALPLPRDSVVLFPSPTMRFVHDENLTVADEVMTWTGAFGGPFIDHVLTNHAGVYKLPTSNFVSSKYSRGMGGGYYHSWWLLCDRIPSHLLNDPACFDVTWPVKIVSSRIRHALAQPSYVLRAMRHATALASVGDQFSYGGLSYLVQDVENVDFNERFELRIRVRTRYGAARARPRSKWINVAVSGHMINMILAGALGVDSPMAYFLITLRNLKVAYFPQSNAAAAARDKFSKSLRSEDEIAFNAPILFHSVLDLSIACATAVNICREYLPEIALAAEWWASTFDRVLNAFCTTHGISHHIQGYLD